MGRLRKISLAIKQSRRARVLGGSPATFGRAAIVAVEAIAPARRTRIRTGPEIARMRCVIGGAGVTGSTSRGGGNLGFLLRSAHGCVLSDQLIEAMGAFFSPVGSPSVVPAAETHAVPKTWMHRDARRSPGRDRVSSSPTGRPRFADVRLLPRGDGPTGRSTQRRGSASLRNTRETWSAGPRACLRRIQFNFLKRSS